MRIKKAAASLQQPFYQAIIQLEYCNNCALVGLVDEVLNIIGLKCLDESLSLCTVLVAVSYSNDICIGLSCIAGSIFNCKSIGAGKTCCKCIVAVDYCQRTFVAVVELSSYCISLNGNDVVAVVIGDIESCYAVCCICSIGKINEAFLLEEEKCSCLVAVVSGDNDCCAFLNVSYACNAVAVKSERLVVDRSSCYKVSAVGSVEAVEVRCVLEVVCIKLTVCKSLVGENVVIVDNDVKGVALVCESVLYKVEDLAVRCGGCAYSDNVVAVGGFIGSSLGIGSCVISGSCGILCCSSGSGVGSGCGGVSCACRAAACEGKCRLISQKRE